MSQAYIGEIRMFGGNFAPYGWAFCDGSLISISDNDALFNLIGTTYGGNGQTNFALPNLSGRMPIHAGTAQGLQTYVVGQIGGSEQVSLITNQIPSHTHTLFASTDNANASVATNNVLAATTLNSYIKSAAGASMNAAAVAQTGGSIPHDNMMPFLCVTFIIALVGVYPPQS